MARDMEVEDNSAADGYADDVLPPLPDVQVLSSKMGKVDFPARVGAASNCFEGPGVRLQPQKCALGPAGVQACASETRATGFWRGCIEVDPKAERSPAAAAALLAPLLAGAVGLDVCGVFADTGLEAASLTFLPSVQEEEKSNLKAVEEELGVPTRISSFYLSGLPGQVISHAASLWLCPSREGAFEALLRLRPLVHVPANRESRFSILRDGPLGPMKEVWREVAIAEFPRLARVMVSGDSAAGTLAVNTRDRYLVEEEDEMLVINAWQREGEEAPAPSTDALSLEQLLWCDVLRALSETTPCAEAAVPAARLRIHDEGLARKEELLDKPKEASEDDAPRLSSLAFLRQYAERAVLEDEVLPRLGSLVRVFSAELAAADESAPALTAMKAPKAKSIDDLFLDDADFRKPSSFATGFSDVPGEKDADPLQGHELTSVLLISETSGFMLAFHCLQAFDPCAI
mmetsp:Transcript_63957/g.113726  ORF Transcript_63957/g.113726 Transcript_63957/m.113726 type:complete len:460 (-) Transcript_63957:55-1434(-)